MKFYQNLQKTRASTHGKGLFTEGLGTCVGKTKPRQLSKKGRIPNWEQEKEMGVFPSKEKLRVIPNPKLEKERRRVKSLRTNKCSTFQTSAHALDKSDTETVLICIPRTPSPCRTFAYIIASVIINTNPALCYFGQFCLVSQIYVLRSNGNGTWCYQCDLLHQQ